MIGFDRAIYLLGLRDRRAVQVWQALALLATGLWVARQVVFARISRAAACSLVALFSMVFLYHRGYDAVTLALPLVYLTARARSTPGGARWAYALAAVSILFVLYVKPAGIDYLTTRSFGWGFSGRLVQALVLPYGTWLILLAMVLLVYGESASRAGTTEARPSSGVVPGAQGAASATSGSHISSTGPESRLRARRNCT